MTPTLREDTVFTGMEQCSAATGISMDMLKRAKSHPDGIDGESGFHISGRIYWAKLKPWIELHGEELTSGSADDYFRWRALKMEFSAKAEQLAYEKERDKLVEKEFVHTMLRRIAAAQSSLFNSKFRQEMAPRLQGQNEQQMQIIIDAAVQDVLSILTKEISQWK